MEVNLLTVSICVVVAFALVQDSLGSTDEVGDNLVRGGIEVQGVSPGVNEDNLDQPRLVSHFSLEVFEGTSVSNCRETYCI